MWPVWVSVPPFSRQPSRAVDSLHHPLAFLYKSAYSLCSNNRPRPETPSAARFSIWGTMRKDYRSPEAQAYRKMYGTAAWRAARSAHLSTHPLCDICQQDGKVTAATVVNHRKPHKGDWSLFIDPSNHQSLCKPHHDGYTQSAERTGRLKGSTADGMPIDPNHPWNR